MKFSTIQNHTVLSSDDILVTDKIDTATEDKHNKRKSFFRRKQKEKINTDATTIVQEERTIQKQYKSSEFGRNITEVYPNKAIIEDNGSFFIQQKFYLCEIFKLESYNLSGLDEDSIQQLIQSYGNLSVLYVEPFKIIMAHSPIKLDKQIEYTKQLIQNSRNHITKVFLQKRLDTFLKIQLYRQQKEFFIMIYGYDIKNLRENISTFMSSKGMLKATPLTRDEKQTLLFQMANIGLQ